MSKRFKPWMFMVIALVFAGGLALAYAANEISIGNVVFLEVCTLTLGVLAVIFLRKMTHPDVSVEQMLYKTDHPTRT